MKNEELNCTVVHVMFYNDENAYTVFNVETADGGDLVCTGNLLSVSAGEHLTLTGKHIEHPKYGFQFQFNSYTRTLPTSELAIEKYLASGIVKGVGEKLANRIVKHFKEETMNIIENYPNKLTEVKGISPKKATDIHTAFSENSHLKSTMLFLAEFDISPAYANKIYERYKGDTVNKIKENPYILADDIAGIGFMRADKIAAKLNVGRVSDFRIRSGILFILKEALNEGHTYLPIDLLLEKAATLLEIDDSIITNELVTLQVKKDIFIQKPENNIYLRYMYTAENYVSNKLLELADLGIISIDNIEDKISSTESDLSISLADNQKQAVITALNNSVCVITGGPGTGKTTIIKTIINILLGEKLEILLVAPTGKAAKRMEEATGKSASTIHRLLGIGIDGRQIASKNEDDPLECDVLIVDEASMVDLILMQHLLRAIPNGTKLIIVGDANQLPSVGAGNVLRDIIKSNALPIVILDEIFRQAQGSAIVMNAHRILTGTYPVLNDKASDFFLVSRPTVYQTLDTLNDLVAKRLPNFKGYNPQTDIQVLTPMKKADLGSENLNKSLQSILNPPTNNKPQLEYRNTIFRVGDRVMQVKNNYHRKWKIATVSGEGVFNGDEGVIEDIFGNMTTVSFDDGRTCEYLYEQLNELSLSYAITIHKSQGSEYKVVVIPLFKAPSLLLNRNLLYTAITRARELVVIVGLESTIKQMVDNNREVIRFSGLCEKLETSVNQ